MGGVCLETRQQCATVVDLAQSEVIQQLEFDLVEEVEV
eukprot:CAMPEP_0173389128 /NCGR_PEP_ID=MMETSP1356-20130122/11284_1 /TAXON_ID=77927 ORGANISM="Hemiselmis virescens, Strain PCC157" /NCGR_SAMPLE_ID=MMETSP1356 /ASSEMBLY_ACC=CAM_ASM_000847 /LENGTH=37 /DNA_ID= /DNA_START= /DNA_END= /DNA_ORIENTATION=